MLTDFAELLELDRRAVALSVELIAPITPDDLSRPTPCAGWDLATLIAHMTAQHRGFAAAADGHGADPEPWQPVPAADPVAAYRSAAAEVLAAFPAAGNTAFTMPELGSRTVPATMAVGFHLVDYVVHAWDVATARGVAFDPAPELVAACLPIALAVPDDDQRLAPGAPFGPAVPAGEAATPLDRLLTALGRDPAR
ncbi:TIGR03086 family protein [Actinoplanes philippinensis]|uniref:TIGR03086 family protein n=1 Tax=Actinoplanes philippinensis TaxID=35752 RepID=A0A1I2E419_9ACTN|nr:TIGR03086 family metal-binding protein [Actinoplanes philippinensis]GIE77313.1 TIGR03086 family protein [Actinoplanes philippinensis]SFE86950.1 TIGR03086 family protein [Actinoplanes philippinensis]